MKNKPRINIMKYLTRSISTLILLLALTIWVTPASAQESAHEETHAEQQNNNHAEHNATHESEHETDLGRGLGLHAPARRAAPPVSQGPEGMTLAMGFSTGKPMAQRQDRRREAASHR